jgi:hypothetical protein
MNFTYHALKMRKMVDDDYRHRNDQHDHDDFDCSFHWRIPIDMQALRESSTWTRSTPGKRSLLRRLG